MATINLGSIKFNWRNAYAGGTTYAVDDVVSYSGSSYICTAASTGNLPTDTNFWDQMSSAGTNGTNGTDLGTTLTTQGDLVYRDGSGLQRLGAGTSGQVLQTGGSGANPSWTTMSSDMVKITTQTLGSDVTTWNLDGYFSSTYRHYRYFCDKFYTSQNGGWTRCRFNESTGTPHTGADYSKFQSSVYTTAITYASDNGADAFTPVQNSTTSNHTGSFEMTIYDPLATRYTACIGQGAGFDGSVNGFSSSFGVVLKRTNALTGISFSDNNGGTLYAGARVTIYGVKA
jgi:hypothetical protein